MKYAPQIRSAEIICKINWVLAIRNKAFKK